MNDYNNLREVQDYNALPSISTAYASTAPQTPSTLDLNFLSDDLYHYFVNNGIFPALYDLDRGW